MRCLCLGEMLQQRWPERENTSLGARLNYRGAASPAKRVPNCAMTLARLERSTPLGTRRPSARAGALLRRRRAQAIVDETGALLLRVLGGACLAAAFVCERAAPADLDARRGEGGLDEIDEGVPWDRSGRPDLSGRGGRPGGRPVEVRSPEQGSSGNNPRIVLLQRSFTGMLRALHFYSNGTPLALNWCCTVHLYCCWYCTGSILAPSG